MQGKLRFGHVCAGCTGNEKHVHEAWALKHALMRAYEYGQHRQKRRSDGRRAAEMLHRPLYTVCSLETRLHETQSTVFNQKYQPANLLHIYAPPPANTPSTPTQWGSGRGSLGPCTSGPGAVQGN